MIYHEDFDYHYNRLNDRYPIYQQPHHQCHLW